jgi:Na+/H+ antiporter NhaD/arsenite permease-like protein
MSINDSIALRKRALFKAGGLLGLALIAVVIGSQPSQGATLLGIPVAFILFALTLIGVAILHGQQLRVALVGLAVIVIFKFITTGFASGPGLAGLGAHLSHEAVTLLNLLGLLTAFALLADHFEKSHASELLLKVIPHNALGAFLLLAGVFVISSFLDNIAAALIGGAMAATLFHHKLHIGYLAAIVAASNAGGAFSVVGDTTTTMMWIAGVQPHQVFEAFVGSLVALCVFGFFAARQQTAYAPMHKRAPQGVSLDAPRLVIAVMMLVTAVAANVLCNLYAPHVLEQAPVIGLSAWAVLLLTAAWRKPTWSLLPDAFKGAIFLLSLVLCASLMPVEKLPTASWPTALGLGFVSAVFDNIPLTALALKQGGYDWGFLAYAVGFGGSMVWFGSSAGVALVGMFPQAGNAAAWVKQGWHVALAYVAGFAAMMLVVGWLPEPAVNKAAAPIALMKAQNAGNVEARK